MTSSETRAHGARPSVEERISSRTFAVLVAAVLAGAFLVRFRGLFHDLWIDEVWTWGIARGRSSVLDVLTMPSSNNHPLNTLVFYWIGDSSVAWVYRLHSLAAGILSVVLAALAAQRSGRLAGLLAAFLVAVSFLMTVYSTEARGYALEVAFGLGAFLAAQSWYERPRAWVLALAWVAIALGFLSQYLFAHVYGALGLWSIGRIVMRRGDRRREIRRAVTFHGLPIIWCAGSWFLVLRHVFNAGSPPWFLSEVLQQTFGWTLGLPLHPLALVLGIGFVAAVVAIDAVQLARAGRDEWLFHVAVIVIAPVASSVLLKDQYLCPRYFLVSVGFFLLALARVLACLAVRARAGLVLAGAIVAAFAVGNLLDTRAFLAGGRGGYRAAVERMAAEDAAPVVTVTGNYDFNVSALLDYYQRFVPTGRQMAFFPRDKLPPQGVGWIVVDEQHFTKPPASKLQAGPMSFVLRGSWTYSGPSGSDWAIYRREP